MGYDYLDRLLANDPLQDACDVTGSDLDDGETTAIAFRNMHALAASKAAALHALGDCANGDSYASWCAIATSLGFEAVHEEVFKRERHDEAATFAIWWDPQRALIIFTDTYTRSDGNTVLNSAVAYGNWIPTHGESHFVEGYQIALASGRFDSPQMSDPYTDWVWVGTWDLREAFRRKIERLDTFGTFVTRWRYAGLIGLWDLATDMAEPREQQLARRWAALPAQLRDALAVAAPT